MADQDVDIRALVQAGEKIQAIKLYRERYGVGLNEAKDVIDALADGQPVVFPSSVSRSGGATGPPVSLNSGENPEIDNLITGGQKVQAIKLVREQTQLGLKESKDLIDQRERELIAEGRMVAKSGCFIATAAFGSEYAPEVAAFRGFRDTVLAQYSSGRRFIGWYYRWSPPLAERLACHPHLCSLVRTLLRPLAKLCRIHFH